jgi:hypothetical protein
MFSSTIEVLCYIADSEKFDGNVSSEAESLYKKLTEFKVILTAHIFLLIFKIIGPVSRYLQTPRLNFKIACDKVRNARVDINKIEFDLVHEKAKAFVEKANDALSEEDELSDICIESDLPVKRISRKKRMDGENCFDERPNNPVELYRFDVFRPIIDQISSSLQERFADENEELYRESNYFAPSSFAEFTDNPDLVDTIDFSSISRLVEITEKDLKSELRSFAQLFLMNRPKPVSQPRVPDEDEIDSDTEDFSNPNTCTEKDNCQQCFLCCHRFLLECNLHCSAFKNLSKVYNFLITLSFTQVQCERSFSKLKMIKTRLRSSLGQDLLESYMLMSTEVDLLNSIGFDDILSALCKESAEMKNLLSC